jgi:hypothetical protein
MAAIVGYLLGEVFTARAIASIAVTRHHAYSISRCQREL